MHARAGSDVHHIICGADSVLIVFHHNQRVAQIAEFLQGGEQLVIVALVQTDTRFIENIQHAGQIGSDLRRQSDALALTA